MEYKTHVKCKRCRGILIPQGTTLCTSCWRQTEYETEARQRACPVCGVEAGYACLIEKWIPGDGYWSGHAKIEQGDAVHEARHPNYKPPPKTPKPVPFWKRTWHFFGGKNPVEQHQGPVSREEADARKAAQEELEAML